MSENREALPRRTRSLAAREASDYFNSLPQEERAKLAPLLEEYRLMGMEEYAREIRGTARKMDMRMRGVTQTQEMVRGVL